MIDSGVRRHVIRRLLGHAARHDLRVRAPARLDHPRRVRRSCPTRVEFRAGRSGSTRGGDRGRRVGQRRLARAADILRPGTADGAQRLPHPDAVRRAQISRPPPSSFRALPAAELTRELLDTTQRHRPAAAGATTAPCWSTSTRSSPRCSAAPDEADGSACTGSTVSAHAAQARTRRPWAAPTPCNAWRGTVDTVTFRGSPRPPECPGPGLPPTPAPRRDHPAPRHHRRPPERSPPPSGHRRLAPPATAGLPRRGQPAADREPGTPRPTRQTPRRRPSRSSHHKHLTVVTCPWTGCPLRR